jgi:nitrite reductase/ring-hydroxylating ferredoxin subunit
VIDMLRPPRRAVACFPLLVCLAGTAGCSATPTPTRDPDQPLSPGDAASSPENVPGPASPLPTVPLISLRQMRIGIPVVVPTDGSTGLAAVVVVRTGTTTVRAFSAACPHRGCTVEVLHGDLVCPCHNSRFVPTTGARIRGLTPTGLAPVAVRVADDQVWPG